MKIYESAEDYLERILMLQETNEHVRSIDIARAMNYSKPSISRAINMLKDNLYIEVDSNGIITFTKKGYEIANKMLERHHLFYHFFLDCGISKENAWNDACKVEHDLSDETYLVIKEKIESLKK